MGREIKPSDTDVYPCSDTLKKIRMHLSLGNINEVYFAHNLIILSRENHNTPIDKLDIRTYDNLCKTIPRMIRHENVDECLYVFINMRYLKYTDQCTYALTHKFMKMYPEAEHRKQLPTKIPLEKIEDKNFRI